MSLTTLADLQSNNERLLQVASSCGNSTEFISLVNKATRMLLKRGNFYGTVQPIVCAAYGNTVTWPNYVGSILAMNVCGRHVDLYNHWYKFMPYDEHRHREWAWAYEQAGRVYQHGELRADFNATSPVFNQLDPLYPMPLRIYIDNPTDAGKTITILGKDANGQIINTLRQDGTWQDGLVVTLAYPFTDTPVSFQIVTRVVKPVTNGVVRGFAIDTANSVLRDLAYYRPTDTNPDYVVSHLQGRKHCPSAPYRVEALVKLQFVPVSNPQDLVLIEDADALTDMVSAIKLKEAGEIDEGQKYELSAIRELNYGLRNKYPIEQFNVSFRPFGNARPERQNIGTMI